MLLPATALLLACAHAAHGLYFYLPQGTERCFLESVPDDTALGVKYENMDFTRFGEANFTGAVRGGGGSMPRGRPWLPHPRTACCVVLGAGTPLGPPHPWHGTCDGCVIRWLPPQVVRIVVTDPKQLVVVDRIAEAQVRVGVAPAWPASVRPPPPSPVSAGRAASSSPRLKTGSTPCACPPTPPCPASNRLTSCVERSLCALLLRL